MKPMFKTVFVMIALIVFVGVEAGTVFGGDDPAGSATPEDIKLKKVYKTPGIGSSLDQKAKPVFSKSKPGKPAVKIVCQAENTTVVGGISKDHFMQLFNLMLPDFYICYRSAAQNGPIAKKIAVLRIVFTPLGKVERSELVSTDITDEELKTCVPKRTERWRIPSTPDGNRLLWSILSFSNNPKKSGGPGAGLWPRTSPE